MCLNDLYSCSFVSIASLAKSRDDLSNIYKEDMSIINFIDLKFVLYIYMFDYFKKCICSLHLIIQRVKHSVNELSDGVLQ